MSVEEFVEKHKGRKVKEKTMGKYGKWIRRFESWRPGSEPDADTLRAWDSYLQDEERPNYPWSNARGPSPPDAYSYRSRVVALSAAKFWLNDEHDAEISTNVQDIAEGEPDPFDPQTLDERGVERVIRTAGMDCDNEHCKMAIKLGYDAVMRGAELVEVRGEDVDRERGTLFVRAVKGSEQSHIEIDPGVFAELEKFMDRNGSQGRLFTNAYDNRWTPSAWNQHFRRKHHEAGFHAFARHSAITNRLKAGEDFGDVYLRARHKSPETTLKYVNMIPDSTAPDWVG